MRMEEVIVENPNGRVKITNLVRMLREEIVKVSKPTKIFLSLYLNMEENPRDGLIWVRWFIPSYPANFTGDEFSTKADKIRIFEEVEKTLKEQISLLPKNKILIIRISLYPSPIDEGKYWYDIEVWRMDPQEAFHMHTYRQYSPRVVKPTNLGTDVWQRELLEILEGDDFEPRYELPRLLLPTQPLNQKRRPKNISQRYALAGDGVNSTRIRRVLESLI